MTTTFPTFPTPFAEPPYLAGLPSPYHTPSHLKWQRDIRAFIEENLLQHAYEWDAQETVPPHVFDKFAEANMLVPNLPAPLPVEWLKELGRGELLGGLKVEDFDYLHGAIYCDEMARAGIAGPSASLTVGMAFGVPPIIKYGSPALQRRFLPALLTGAARACIAITEPDAGSDVANIATTATKTADGKHYVVNGAKKWITNGIWSDYAAMAVRTGGEGSGAVTNFNHERLTIAIGTTRSARVAIASATAYVMRREAFGKPLIDQPVVRHRLAKAGAELESLQAWVDQFVYQMTRLSKEDADVQLGGLTALAKARAGMVFDECARCAVLLFGGNGYTRTGQGEIAERLYREVPGQRIPGGSEDVLLDLAIRQLVKNYRNKTKALERPSGSSKL
ncbi:putative acyl- dehydrogenase [Diplodia seriata]|uniref:Putative acyl-dehydrogenase n=1 Tax=Diplodia seriata TaxID=420778 RepID=A0A0G2EPF5_9PEZI|nr:putative acyl- dehydrogenase [Diplodia seriata]